MMGGAVVPQRFDLKYMLNLDTVGETGAGSNTGWL